jgi:hypothetical protein
MRGSSFGSPDQCRWCSLRSNCRSHHHTLHFTSLLPPAGFESRHVWPDDRRVQLCVCVRVLVHSRLVAWWRRHLTSEVCRHQCDTQWRFRVPNIDVLLIHTHSSHRRCRNAISIISICCPSCRTLLPHVNDDATGKVPSFIPLTKP